MYNNICLAIIVILDLENIGLDALFVKLSYIEPKYIEHNRFFHNGRSNLHIKKLPKFITLTTKLIYLKRETGLYYRTLLGSQAETRIPSLLLTLKVIFKVIPKFIFGMFAFLVKSYRKYSTESAVSCKYFM